MMVDGAYPTFWISAPFCGAVVASAPVFSLIDYPKSCYKL